MNYKKCCKGMPKIFCNILIQLISFYTWKVGIKVWYLNCWTVCYEISISYVLRITRTNTLVNIPEKGNLCKCSFSICVFHFGHMTFKSHFQSVQKGWIVGELEDKQKFWAATGYVVEEFHIRRMERKCSVFMRKKALNGKQKHNIFSL